MELYKNLSDDEYIAIFRKFYKRRRKSRLLIVALGLVGIAWFIAMNYFATDRLHREFALVHSMEKRPPAATFAALEADARLKAEEQVAIHTYWMGILLGIGFGTAILAIINWLLFDLHRRRDRLLLEYADKLKAK